MLISLAWEAGASGNPASSSNLSHRITVGCLAAFFFFCARTLTHTLESNGFTPIDVNITATSSCFVCPVIAADFSLNSETLMDAPPDVVINSTTVSIFNWSAVPLKLLFVNVIACRDTVGFIHTTMFFSLSKHYLFNYDM